LIIEQLLESFLRSNPNYSSDYLSNEMDYIVAAGSVVGTSYKETQKHYDK